MAISRTPPTMGVSDSRANLEYNYTMSGFDNFLRRLPPTKGEEVTEDMFSVRFPQVPGETISSPVPEPRIVDAVDKTGRRAPNTTASIVLNNGGTAQAVTHITDPAGRIMVAICEATAFQGTLGSNSGRLPFRHYGKYKVYSAPDYYSDLANSPSPSRSLSHILCVHNVSAGSQTVWYSLRWRYIGTLTDDVQVE